MTKNNLFNSIVFLFLFLIKHGSAMEMPVLVVGELSSVTVDGLEWFSGSQRSLAAIFPLAIEHFNNRDGSIIPQFASPTCNVTMKLVQYVDDEGMVSIPLKVLVAQQAIQRIHAIFGPVTSQVAEPLATTASALQIPVVSHWATSAALADKSQYEFFSRTCPSDASLAPIVAELFSLFNYTKVGMVYVNSDFGQGWQQDLLAACDSLGIQLVSIGFDDVYGESLDKCKLLFFKFNNKKTTTPETNNDDSHSRTKCHVLSKSGKD